MEVEEMEVQRTAAAATQRRQRPSGGNDPAARKWRCSEPAAAATQRRQRPSGGNEPANQRRWRGRLQGERREK
ncbi:hypothetical protein DEO72_LG1g2158 [Vigna unguiculata]|uniref:Uncharacterized protein n=1 Tax=Vigna unguiculata TaxID=3917 RepID=A0A4D6KPT6_VIGUN|nr:hypothetical protein DEO72_LG1g2158 [Vigna unguiculata]